MAAAMSVVDLNSAFATAADDVSVMESMELPPEMPKWILTAPVTEANATTDDLVRIFSGREPVVFRAAAPQFGQWRVLNSVTGGSGGDGEVWIDELVKAHGAAVLDVAFEARGKSKLVHFFADQFYAKNWVKEKYQNWTEPSKLWSREVRLRQVLQPTKSSKGRTRLFHGTTQSLSKGPEAVLCEDDSSLAVRASRPGLPEGPEGDWAAGPEGVRHAACTEKLWAASAGTRYAAHYDASRNLYVQLLGRKRFTLVRPRHFAATGVHFYPTLHPLNRQVRRWGKNATKGLPAPAYATVTLEPGDALFMPSYTIHHTASVSQQPTIAQNIFWKGSPELWRDRWSSESLVLGLMFEVQKARKENKWDPAVFLTVAFATAQWLAEGCLGGPLLVGEAASQLSPAPTRTSKLMADLLRGSYREKPSAEGAYQPFCKLPSAATQFAPIAARAGGACGTWLAPPPLAGERQDSCSATGAGECGALGENNAGSAQGAHEDGEAIRPILAAVTIELFLQKMLEGNDDDGAPMSIVVWFLQALAAGCKSK